MKIMTAAPSLNMNLNEGEFEDALQLALDYVKTQRLSYVFAKPWAKPLEWVISTWAKQAKPSMVRQHGTVTDKSHLPEMTRFNQPRESHGRKRKRQPMAASARRIPFRDRQQMSQTQQPASAFAQAFPSRERTP